MSKLEAHLGGHCGVTHIDLGVLQMMKKEFNVQTIYDVGCGPGGMIKAARSCGIDSIGIDGDYTLSHPTDMEVVLHDFTKGKLDLTPRDACWSCEFLEHVEEKYLDNIFSVFCKAKYIFCTASNTPGGHHHVNMHDSPYWIDQFEKRGFTFSPKYSNMMRLQSTMPRNFVRQTGMVYIKE